MDIYIAYYTSEIGVLEIKGNDRGILSVNYASEPREYPADIPACLQACVTQLDEYFRGQRQSFSLPLQPQGSSFERQVWNELLNIPFGETRSYGAIASTLGDIKLSRDVGVANARNPIAIIVPCHRVIGSDGTLTGYAGGLWRKEWLLAHEGRPFQKRLFG